MEDDLKILIVEYLSNQLLDFPQFLYLRLGKAYGTKQKLKIYVNEDDLKILIVEYLSNHLLDFLHFLNLRLWEAYGTKPKLKIYVNEDDLKWKTTSKY